MVAKLPRKKFTMTENGQCFTRSKPERSREKNREGLRPRRTVGRTLHPIFIHLSKDLNVKNSKDKMAEVPLIPAEEIMSCNNVQDNLVMLEVGPHRDTWRYCVERQRLADRSEWFRAMLVGPLAPPPSTPPPTVRLEHVEKRAFDHLLRYLHDEPVNFQSVSTARATLDVAHQYLCPQLARLAIKYLEANLTSNNVLEVLQGLKLYAANLGKAESPSAPPLPGDEAGEIAVACASLLGACMNVVDSEPAAILPQERFEELTREEVAEIAERDTLNLRHEGVLFTALDRWAASECRRHGVEPTPCNKRTVLNDEIWFSVRFTLMTDKEFIEGPMASGVLTSKESAFIVAKILGHHHDRQQQQLQDATVGPLSRLSNVPRRFSMSAAERKLKKYRHGKLEREENRKNRKRECASQGQRACASLGNCLVRVLACVFD
ncbi:BTB/POZ domain-containing protein 6-like isoform X2 [Athalia rosae]|uniref:BTB/POZ domain-containing protein 6-like isoform X2 n=1 Tax=Athalia rosae TaxID=37344 RepID=UPI0020347FF6|nr:BTB/POZ domain-containing protein 6-like isoform X2 [Athalia rosae]